jgi:hypothetical protein
MSHWISRNPSSEAGKPYMLTTNSWQRCAGANGFLGFLAIAKWVEHPPPQEIPEETTRTPTYSSGGKRISGTAINGWRTSTDVGPFTSASAAWDSGFISEFCSR